MSFTKIAILWPWLASWPVFCHTRAPRGHQLRPSGPACCRPNECNNCSLKTEMFLSSLCSVASIFIIYYWACGTLPWIMLFILGMNGERNSQRKRNGTDQWGNTRRNTEQALLQLHYCVTSGLVELTITPTLCLTCALTAVFVLALTVWWRLHREINITQFISPFIQLMAGPLCVGWLNLNWVYWAEASFLCFPLSDAPPPLSVLETTADLDCSSR